MKQKVALTAAHLLAQGTVADMGMGSGSGSYALAALYPSLNVIGVDINPTMVELAREHHRLPNLSFVCGDIAGECFPPGSLDGIFDSSVLHHVTTFNGYDRAAAARALEVQARQLREHGMLIVRDFVDPGQGEVVLELNPEDAELFLRFSREFRKLSDSPGFPYQQIAPGQFRVSRTMATEFVLRKDYRRDWETEILEEYTYMTQQQFEAAFARLGLRMLASTPLWNPWIVRHRFEGCFVMRDLDGRELEFPPTNYLIAGEKVGAGEGVRFEERKGAPLLGFLSMDYQRHRSTGRVRDLVRRPHPTIDVVPWFESGGELFVLARKSYPRPILAAEGSAPLDQSTAAHYVTEPLNVLQQDKPFGRTVVDLLAPFARIRNFAEGCTYYPSPGGIEEEVRSSLVEVEPILASGPIRAIEITQLLRSAQVGGMSDARLEMNAYRLLRLTGRDPGPWIGDAIALTSEVTFPPSDVAELLGRSGRRVFEDASESSGFLELRCSRFVEHAADEGQVAAQALEFVVPRSLSINTIATALLARRNGQILIGVDDDDLPAAQSFNGNSSLLVAPAWRLPRAIVDRRDGRRWIEERLLREYGLRVRQWWELGGRYHPSPGITPERVYPYALEVDAQVAPGERPLYWLPLEEAARHADRLHEGHLRIVLFRALHTLSSSRA